LLAAGVPDWPVITDVSIDIDRIAGSIAFEEKADRKFAVIMWLGWMVIGAGGTTVVQGFVADQN
jgi:hypothetical protein